MQNKKLSSQNAHAAMETFIKGAIQASQTSSTQQKYDAEIAPHMKVSIAA